MRSRAVGILLAMLAVRAAVAADYEATMAALLRGLPDEVGALIHRIVDCNHWGGEEGYDDARKAEIAAAMDSLGCGSLDREEVALRRQYGAAPAVLQALDKAKELLF